MLDLTSMHHALIGWFGTNKEDLPWRQRHDPYAVWLSEIMLQQTRVDTVIPYFIRFIERFPDVHSLARASVDDVLKAWEGLGYYRRAHHLHRTAQIVARDFAGNFPSSCEELVKLPGIGKYTAGAIASLAFGERAPILDGNVIRILTRVLDISDDVNLTTTRDSLWKLADELLPAERPGLWNEGLMELGRKVCAPKAPRCLACPLSAFCQARKLGVQEERPVKQARQPIPHYDVAAGVIWNNGRVLIAQRRLESMMGGLWEFPGGKCEPGETLEACLQREILEELGIQIHIGTQVMTMRHAYTHFKITLYVFECMYVGGAPRPIECADWAWVRLDELGKYAFPVTDQRIIATLRANV